MAETLRIGDLIGGEDTMPGGGSYYDSTLAAYEPPGMGGDLYDLGSVSLPWGLEAVRCPNSTHMDLIFSGSVGTFGLLGTDPTSYSISPALAIKSANVVATNIIQLETARQAPGIAYTVTMTVVEASGMGAPV